MKEIIITLILSSGIIGAIAGAMVPIIEKARLGAKNERIKLALSLAKQAVVFSERVFGNSGAESIVKFDNAKAELADRLVANKVGKYFTDAQLEGYIEQAFIEMKEKLHNDGKGL